MDKNKVIYNPFDYKNNITDTNQSCIGNVSNMIDAGMLSGDKTGRMSRLLKKLQNGEKTIIVALGGSITEGSGASNGEYYIDNLDRYLKNKYPNADIQCINAGRGTTTSLFGVSRIERDILPLDPDMVIVEYAVNDTILDEKIAAETFEGLIRKLLFLPSAPAIFCLFCCLGSFGSMEHIEAKIAGHYGLPAASLANSIKYDLNNKIKNPDKKMNAEEIEKWVVENYIFDGCHPNTKGYYILTDYIMNCIASGGNIKTAGYITPEPLYSDRFVTSRILDNRHLEIIHNDGWKSFEKHEPYDEYGYIPERPGAKIIFRLPECRLVTFVSRRSIKPYSGTVLVSVDGGSETEIDSFFENGWGTHNNFKLLLDEPESSVHTITVSFSSSPKDNTLKYAVENGYDVNNAGSRFIISEIEIA